MADPERKRRLEHTHETAHISYGHYGTATYDHEATQSWRFLRQYAATSGTGTPREEEASSSAPSSVLRLLHQRVAKPSDGSPRSKQPSSGLTRIGRSHQVYRERPELAFASTVLAGGYNETEVGVPQRDLAFSGQRLSCGHAVGLNIRGHRSVSAGVPIVMSADGVAGENVWVSPVVADSFIANDGSGVETQTTVSLTSKHGLQYGLASAEPILQICFSRHHNFIGVRKASTTTLLRSLWLGRSEEPQLLGVSSSIRIEDILVLPISRTGGQPHAHLAFNPRDERQLALVDVHGVWSIWGLSDKASSSSRVLSRARLQSSGRLLPRGSLTTKTSSQDGWHRLCWLSSKEEPGEDLLLVCSRQVAAVFSVSGEMLGEVDMRIGVKTAKDHILDVQQCSNHSDICFVLTSTRILVMRVADEVFNTEVHQEPLTSMCLWDHFRGQQDTTLRMSVLGLTDNSQGSLNQGMATTMVHFFLFSQRNKYVTRNILTVTMAVIGGARTLSVSDPSSFRLPEVILKHRSPVFDMVYVATRDEHTTGNLSSGRGNLITLLARMDDGTISEAVYDYTEPHGVGKFHREPGLCLPMRPKGQNQRIASSKYVDDDDNMDDFLVKDSCERVGYGDSHRDLKGDEGKSARALHHKPRAWVDVLPGRAVDDADADFNTVLDTLSSALSNEVSDIGKLLVEKTTTARIDDVEGASEALARYINDTSRSVPRTDEARLCPVSNITRSPHSLLEQYNDLIDQYVAALPADIPDRLRVNTERLSRAAALEKSLASYTLQQNRHTEAEMLREPTTAESFNDEVKVSAEATEPMPVDKSPISHLSRYTTVSRGTPHVFNLKATTEVLGHLPVDINTDPSEYSYKDAELQLAMARNRLDTDLDPEAKRHAEKLSRYEKKKLERERRQAEDMALQQAMKPNQVMSSQLPQAGSSQLGGSQVINATQRERGAFGARQRVPKAGKKRVAGF